MMKNVVHIYFLSGHGIPIRSVMCNFSFRELSSLTCPSTMPSLCVWPFISTLLIFDPGGFAFIHFQSTIYRNIPI
jgi:hypothetical protein